MLIRKGPNMRTQSNLPIVHLSYVALLCMPLTVFAQDLVTPPNATHSAGSNYTTRTSIQRAHKTPEPPIVKNTIITETQSSTAARSLEGTSVEPDSVHTVKAEPVDQSATDCRSGFFVEGQCVFFVEEPHLPSPAATQNPAEPVGC